MYYSFRLYLEKGNIKENCITLYRFHDSLFNCLSAAIGNLQPWLQLACGIHQTPFILPCLVFRVELHLPWFIECLEPASVSKRAHPCN